MKIAAVDVLKDKQEQSESPLDDERLRGHLEEGMRV